MHAQTEQLKRVYQLKAELRTHEEASHKKIAEIETIQRNCTHNWSKPEYTPEHTKAYTIPGDRPGTMGVDWRGPTHVPAQTTKKWTRTCLYCDKKEVTTETNKTTIEIEEPKF